MYLTPKKQKQIWAGILPQGKYTRFTYKTTEQRQNTNTTTQHFLQENTK